MNKLKTLTNAKYQYQTVYQKTQIRYTKKKTWVLEKADKRRCLTKEDT